MNAESLEQVQEETGADMTVNAQTSTRQTQTLKRMNHFNFNQNPGGK